MCDRTANYEDVWNTQSANITSEAASDPKALSRFAEQWHKDIIEISAMTGIDMLTGFKLRNKLALMAIKIIDRIVGCFSAAWKCRSSNSVNSMTPASGLRLVKRTTGPSACGL